MFDSNRIKTGLIIAAAIIIIALLDIYVLNALLFMVLIFLAFNEAKKIFNTPNASVCLVLLAFVISAFSRSVSIMIILTLIIIVLANYVYKKEDNLHALMPYIYPTLPIFVLWQVYLEGGMFVLFWLIFIVSICDSGAYFIGKIAGKTSFTPTSPNKTREGVVGGIVMATFFGMIFGVQEFDLVFSLIGSFVCSIFAVIGDLLESYFKRKAGVKDSGNLLPGHGGILDRIDALIIASFAMVLLI